MQEKSIQIDEANGHTVASIKAAMASPPLGCERWTARALAEHVGVSHSTVLRVWRDAEL